MTRDEARRIAGEWHGGQTSPLYAFASTGTILPGWRAEIAECREAIQNHYPGANPEVLAGRAYASRELHSLALYLHANSSDELETEEL